jgi:D-alanine transaminase
MNRTVYVNGDFVAEDRAVVSVFDRGFLMADGVYEVTAVIDGKLVDFHGHTQRLERSLCQLDMQNPLNQNQWLDLHRELVRLNDLQAGIVYIQVTRGNPGDRDFRFPNETRPTVIGFTQSKPDLASESAFASGWRVISVPDLRWKRRDIKTTQLLYPCMGKMMALQAGADDAWFVEDEMVTEGTSNNTYIILDHSLVTRPVSHALLSGITRAAILQFAESQELEVQLRPFSIAEAQSANEAFVTSASALVVPVVEIDGQPIGTGRPGPIAQRLRAYYIQEMRAAAI